LSSAKFVSSAEWQDILQFVLCNADLDCFELQTEKWLAKCAVSHTRLVQSIAQQMHNTKPFGFMDSPPSLRHICARYVWMHNSAFHSSVPDFAQLLPKGVLRLIETSGKLQRTNTKWRGQDFAERLYFFGGRFLCVHQQHRVLHGGLIWHSAPLLCEYLQQRVQQEPGCWSGKRVMELGAGPALVGLLARHYGAFVTISDLGQFLKLIRRNVRANFPTKMPDNSSSSSGGGGGGGSGSGSSSSGSSSSGSSSSSSSGSSSSSSGSSEIGDGGIADEFEEDENVAVVSGVHVAELEWGNQQHIDAVLARGSSDNANECANECVSPLSHLPPSLHSHPLNCFDVILGSDILYMVEAVRPLIKTLLALSGPQTRIILAYQQHLCSEAALFFDLIHSQQLFSMTELPVPVCMQADSSVVYRLCELRRIFV
jgi:predicted nicotinamide N-methyase